MDRFGMLSFCLGRSVCSGNNSCWRSGRLLRLGRLSVSGRSPSQSHNISEHHAVYRFLHIDQTSLRPFSNHQPTTLQLFSLSENEYEKVAEETLESLTSYFDEILEKSSLEDPDVMYGSGVLTIKLGKYGIYVINKQTPNRQIWLSSPTTGPKRYDFIDGTWIYKHEDRSMYELLNEEIPRIVQVSDIDFTRCSFGKSKNSV